MKKKFFGILMLVCLLTAICVAAVSYSAFGEAASDLQSFEGEAVVPSNYAAERGNLSLSSNRYKMGNRSLKWQVKTNQDSLTIKNENYMVEAGAGRNIKSSGFMLWLYNEQALESAKLTFLIGDSKQFDGQGKPTFSFDFNLNFVGWRTMWIRLYDDTTYDFNDIKKYREGELLLDTMRIIAPQELKGKSIYLDDLEFRKNIFWNRSSDYQILTEKRVDDGTADIGNWSGAYLYSKRKPHIEARPVTESEIADLNEIENRLDEWLLGTGVIDNPRQKGLAGMVKNATKKYDSLEVKFVNGVWTGKGLECGVSPYTNYGAEKFSRGTAETIFLPLALDYKINKNAKSLELLMNLFDFWHDQGWAYGSGIGSLDHETLRSSGYFGAVYVVRDELKQTGRLAREEATVDWFSEFGKVYLDAALFYEETTADEMRTHFLNRLIRVLLMDSSVEKVQAMKSYTEWVNGALRVNPNRGDTIKPDYTGFHHNNVYMNAYPPHGYHMASMINYILQDTQFAISTDAAYNLKQALITHDVLTNSTTVPFQVRGRFPVQNSEIGQEILASYAYMALSGDPKTGDAFDREMAGIFMKNYNLIGTSGQKAVKGQSIGGISLIHTYGAYEMLMEVIGKGVPPALPQSGMWSMPYAGMAVLRRDDWMVAVKGFSKYMWDFESGTDENMFGRYSSYGMINILSAGKELEGNNYIDDLTNGFDYNNGWDWNRLAGTTTIHLPYKTLSAKDGAHRNYSDSAFLGAVSSCNSEGAWGMELSDNTYDKSFKAKKSVFMLDNEIIVLGSDIVNTDTEHNTETTLFQNAIFDTATPITFSGDSITSFPYEKKVSEKKSAWLLDAYGNGYFLRDASGLNISRAKQDSFKADGKTASTGNYASAWINHGKSPKDAGYEYVIKVRTTNEEMSKYAQKDTYSVLKKDADAHVISTADSETTAYVVFSEKATLPNSGIINQTDTPILAYSKRKGDTVKLSVADPDLRIGSETESTMKNSVMKTATVTLRGNWQTSLDLPNVRIISALEDETIIEFDCIDGKTLEVELTDANKAANETPSEQHNNLVMYAIIIAIVVAVAAIVGFFLLKAYKKRKS